MLCEKAREEGLTISPFASGLNPEGACTCVSFDPLTQHCLASFRPGRRYPQSRHLVSRWEGTPCTDICSAHLEFATSCTPHLPLHCLLTTPHLSPSLPPSFVPHPPPSPAPLTCPPHPPLHLLSPAPLTCHPHLPPSFPLTCPLPLPLISPPLTPSPDPPHLPPSPSPSSPLT